MHPGVFGIEAGTVERCMPNRRDTIHNRALLATARARFSSEVQPLKQNALDKIVTNIFYTAPDDRWMDASQVRNAFRQDSGGYVLNEADIEASLRRLRDGQYVEAHPKQPFRLYRLTVQAQEGMASIQQEAERRLESVLCRLFGSDQRGFRRYGSCFLDILSTIFGQLGEESARLISRNLNGMEVLSASSLPQSLATARTNYPDLDHDLVQSAIDTFFREDDPEYNEIKWNLAQNLFVAKALGLDPTGALLSQELFQDAIFYLDTNVIIAGLEPTHRGHGWFQSFVASAQALKAQLRICPPTLEELDDWVNYQRQLFEKVAPEIPAAIASRVDSLFLDKYKAACQEGRQPTTDEIFATFDSPGATLAGTYGVELDDDPWFHTTNSNGRLDRFAAVLQARSQTIRGKTKGPRVARHDAKVLAWVERQRARSSVDVWLVTTDRSLPGAVPGESEASSLALTAATLLQWISPMVENGGAETDFASGFAQMIRERLLPRDRFFDLQDFLVFHELHISIKDLPAEDVERTLRAIRANAPHLDPSNPEDLQQISRIVARNLVDPGTKYKQELARLEAEQERERDKHALELQSAQRGIDELKSAMVSAEAKHRQDMDDLRTSLEEVKTQAVEDKRLGEAKLRLVLVGLTLLVVELVIFFLTDRYGDGANRFQKVRDSWLYFGLAASAVLFLGGWFIGKERLSALGWPFSKIFRAE